MKTIGKVLFVIGLIGLIIFGYQALQDSESFSILGAEIAVSSADWTPVIVSAVILVVGFLLSRKK